jgi:dihydroorotate dehydrogenase (NAD+) catalytic subunit
VEAGADALTVANTVLGTAVDVRTRRPILGNISGGLSGPAVKPIALQKVMEIARWLRREGLFVDPKRPERRSIPIIASGGIMTAQDAMEFMMMGASAFMLGTALFVDPMSPRKVLDGLKQLLAELGEKDVNDIVGTAKID